MRLLHQFYLIPVVLLLSVGASFVTKANAQEHPSDSVPDSFILHFGNVPEKGEKTRFTPVCISRGDAQHALRNAGFDLPSVTRKLPEERTRTIYRVRNILDAVERGHYQNIITTHECAGRFGQAYYERAGDEDKQLTVTRLPSGMESSEHLDAAEARAAIMSIADSRDHSSTRGVTEYSDDSSKNGQDFVVIHYDESPEICWDNYPPVHCAFIEYFPVCMSHTAGIAVLEKSEAPFEDTEHLMFRVGFEGKVPFSEMERFFKRKEHILTTRKCAEKLIEIYEQETAGEGRPVYLKEILKFSEGLPVGRWREEP